MFLLPTGAIVWTSGVTKKYDNFNGAVWSSVGGHIEEFCYNIAVCGHVHAVESKGGLCLCSILPFQTSTPPTASTIPAQATASPMAVLLLFGALGSVAQATGANLE